VITIGQSGDRLGLLRRVVEVEGGGDQAFCCAGSSDVTPAPMPAIAVALLLCCRRRHLRNLHRRNRNTAARHTCAACVTPNRRASALACGVAIERRHLRLQLCPGHQLFKVSQEAISASLLFLAGVFEFGEGASARA
jgi:hypothetical protein